MERKSFVRTCVASLAVVGAGLVVAGPLSPPAGPVASTHKTLTDVEPRTAVNGTNTPGDADSLYKITQPGSYYLTGSITGVAGKHGVEITSSGVSLDLNGFDLEGVPGMGAFDGVSVTVDSLRGIAVLNGSVRNWGDGGVDLGFLSRGCRVEGVRASGNAGTGITSSISSTVTNCTSSFNGQRGIFSSNGSTISNCSVETNSGNGIQVNHGCTIVACAAYVNGGVGILAGLGCSVIDSSLFNNTSHGLQLGDDGNAARCSANGNDGRGISAGSGCTISECTASFSGENGIFVGGGSTVSGCTARSNAGHGISCLQDATIRGCISSANAVTGIDVTSGAVIDCTTIGNGTIGIDVEDFVTVVNCTSRGNASHGITAFDDCLISGNICIGNGDGASVGYGIRCEGVGSQIVGNKCNSNDIGISVESGGNVITENSCDDNGIDWQIVAGNAVGPILDRRVPGGAGIVGFSAPTTLNTTDPHANFSH